MPKRSSRPKTDPNLLAASILAQVTASVEEQPAKNRAAVALGRMGGLKEGKARAEALTPAKRAQIAKKAAAARWSKSSVK